MDILDEFILLDVIFVTFYPNYTIIVSLGLIFNDLIQGWYFLQKIHVKVCFDKKPSYICARFWGEFVEKTGGINDEG